MSRSVPRRASCDIPHAIKDVADVVSTLRGVRETTVGCALSSEAVNAARAPWDLGTTKLLDGSYTTKSPEVSIGDPGKLLLDILEEGAGDVQTIVGSVLCLRLETHGSIVAIRGGCRERRHLVSVRGERSNDEN